MSNVPTQGEVFAKLMEHIRYAQEGAASYAHLCRANGDTVRADGFLRASEQFKKTIHLLTQLATRHIQ